MLTEGAGAGADRRRDRRGDRVAGGAGARGAGSRNHAGAGVAATSASTCRWSRSRCVVSVLAAVLFSAVSCISLANTEQRAVLASTRGTSMSGGARRAASLLVAGEIALAGILLVGAGLTLRSFANLIAVDPGFRTDNVLTLQMSAAGRALSARRRRRRISIARAFARSKTLPEVEHAGAAAVMPLTGNNWTVALRSRRSAGAGGRASARSRVAGGDAPATFAALEIPLKAGRLFEDRDRHREDRAGDHQRRDRAAVLPRRGSDRPSPAAAATTDSRSSASSATSAARR